MAPNLKKHAPRAVRNKAVPIRPHEEPLDQASEKRKRALDLLDLAMDTPKAAAVRKLARQAIKLDPECVDALILDAKLTRLKGPASRAGRKRVGADLLQRAQGDVARPLSRGERGGGRACGHRAGPGVDCASGRGGVDRPPAAISDGLAAGSFPQAGRQNLGHAGDQQQPGIIAAPIDPRNSLAGDGHRDAPSRGVHDAGIAAQVVQGARLIGHR